MQNSDRRRAAIVKRLESLDMSTKKELEDILTLATLICETPIALITLLDDTRQHFLSRVGLDTTHTDVKDAFCRYTVLQSEITEVPDSLVDERFKDNPLVVGDPHIRFYAGSPLTTKEGVSLGSLCVIDRTPRQLDLKQKSMLEILARQVSTILDLELSLRMLREETSKLQDSEVKLKSIFQSSPHSHIFVDRDFTVLAFNYSAARMTEELNNKTIHEGDLIFNCLNPEAVDVIRKNVLTALDGQSINLELQMDYSEVRREWWSVDFNPVRNIKNEIIGVSIDAANITTSVKAKQEVLSQNTVLKEIAFAQSHNIRRPVANLQGLLPLLIDQAEIDFRLHHQFMCQEVDALDSQIQLIVKMTNELTIKELAV